MGLGRVHAEKQKELEVVIQNLLSYDTDRVQVSRDYLMTLLNSG